MVAPRRVAVLRQRMGGPPAGFAAGCVACTALLFPLRLLAHHGAPVAQTLTISAVQAVIVMIAAMAAGAGQRRFDEVQSRADSPDAENASAEVPPVRRGAVVGLTIAVLFFGGLLALCLLSGRSWLLSVFFGITLVVLATQAIGRLRRGAEASSPPR
jgi:uncharacterized protein YacL